ncbi:MAG: Cna B-type domain-containing protein, partial [Absicoccus porci]|uniref:Cna B-type domain-containing protein n=1 Tax=Absicoccus porci TaxID=2486576 RepID=UPI002409CB50
TVSEDAVKDYSSKQSGTDFINTHEAGKTSVNVKKIWDDANNQDGIRPEKITVQLLADGEKTDKTLTLNADNNWNGSFTDLDAKKKGKTIQYSIAEVSVPDGYTSKIEGNATEGYIITNTHKAETIDISGKKTWEDNDNQDGTRPDSITIRLMANGNEIKKQEVKADKDGNWTYKFADLPKYDSGKEIKYTIQEDKIAGYTSEVKGYDLINTHKIEKTKVSVKKVWNDTKNQDGKRPDSVTVHLFADGKDTNRTVKLNSANNWKASFEDLNVYQAGQKIEYTVSEDKVDGYDTSINGTATDGFTITNTHKTETIDISGKKTWKDNDNQDGTRPDSITIRLMANGNEIKTQEVKADKDGNWTYKFAGLPKYEKGQEIDYTVSEDAVKDYSSKQSGTDFINTHEAGKTSVNVKKIWDDSENRDGIRPGSITVQLLANGEKTDKTLTLNADNNWNGSFTDLDAKKKGKTIEYTIAEASVPEGYKSEISGNATEGYIINNTHKTETVDISGTKTWKDNDNQDGKRPDKITVTLMANGEDEQSKEIAGDWTYAFNNLPKYDNGKEIKYTIKEDKVAGYTSEVKGYDLINTHKTETTSISVKKQWDDTKNQDGKRPTEVTVHLYADGKDTGKTVTLSAKNDWKASFNDLDVNKDGKAIEYTVKEDEVKDYETSTSGDAKSGFVLTNSHKTETVNISGTKTWADNDNQDGARPDSITIRLMADGKEIQKQEVKADKDGNWTYAFNDLPKYANGQEITYTVSEDAVKDYTTTQKGNDFTNTHKVGKTSVSVKKIWKDSNNQDGIRPEKITVELLANGEKTDKTLTLDEKNNWSGSFTDLDAKKKGKDIQYSIAEVSVPKGYKSIITGDATKGYIVTNTHTTHRTTTGKKTNHTSGTNTGMETNVRFYSLSTIVSLLAIAFFRRRFVK